MYSGQQLSLTDLSLYKHLGLVGATNMMSMTDPSATFFTVILKAVILGIVILNVIMRIVFY
jgi:hypothetical protein